MLCAVCAEAQPKLARASLGRNRSLVFSSRSVGFSLPSQVIDAPGVTA
jgi:hypothetical protein